MTISDKYLLKLWHTKAGERAENKCEICGIESDCLQTHHIFSKSNKSICYDLINALHVCNDHHRWAEKVGELYVIAFLIDNKIRDLNWMNELIARKNVIVKYNNLYRIEWKERLFAA